MLRGRRQALAAVLGATLVLVIALPWLIPDFWLFIATSAATGALVSLSVGVVAGRTGMLTLCQFSFAAVGAWFVSWLNVQGINLPTPVVVLAGGLVAVPFGILVGLPALRIRGINLAVVTLAFAGAGDVFLTLHTFPGSTVGNIVERTPGFSSDPAFFWMSCGFVAAAIALVVALGRRPIGNAWLAVRHSERAAAALGLSVARVKLSSFAIGALIAGIAGGLLTTQNGAVSPDSFSTLQSLLAFSGALIFGARYPEGAVLAGIVTAFVPEILHRLGISLDVMNLLFGLGTIQALAMGEGAAEALRRKLRRVFPAPAPEVVPVPVPVAPSRHARGVQADAPAGLAITGLSVSYGEVRVLDGVDLMVPALAVTALIGPNGAGKSTLVDAVSGFLPRYGGSVHLGQVALDGLPVHARARAGLRRTFQRGLTVPYLTGHEYLQLAAGRRMSAAEAAELLEFVDGPDPTQTLSDVDVGSRRLVEVAGGLAARPQVLLLDEPGAGLPVEESRMLAERLADIPDRFGCAVLVIDHDMELVQAACSAITVIDFGRVIASGPAGEVLAHSAVIDAYLGAEEAAIS